MYAFTSGTLCATAIRSTWAGSTVLMCYEMNRFKAILSIALPAVVIRSWLGERERHAKKRALRLVVIPAKAGIQTVFYAAKADWIPARAALGGNDGKKPTGSASPRPDSPSQNPRTVQCTVRTFFCM